MNDLDALVAAWLDNPEDAALDRLVHVAVMGRECRWIDEPDWIGEFGGDRQFHNQVWWDEDARLPIPEYSAGWAGLGLVVEEMRRRGWRYSIETWPYNLNKVRAMFINDAKNNGQTDESPAVAVCKAALFAVLAERSAGV